MFNKITVSIGVGIVILLALGGVLILRNKQPASPGDEFASPRTFNPFGIFGDSSPLSGNSGTSSDQAFTPTEFTPALRRVALRSASDVVLVGTGTTTQALFIERETGHVFGLDVTTGALRRITNTTIPRIQSASFAPNGEYVVAQYLRDDGETTETFLGDIPLGATTTDRALLGELLPPNIISFAWSPDGSELFYLNRSSSGSFGTRHSLVSGTKRALFSSPLDEWNVFWTQTNTLFLSTRASGAASGNLFSLSTSGVLREVVSDLLGLTALPGSATHFVGTTGGGTVRSFLYTPNGVPTDLSVGTLAEKCGWDSSKILLVCGAPKSIPVATLPDDWYRGTVSFEDRLWAIDSETATLVILADPKTYTDIPLDVVHTHVSDDGLFVMFINKTDGTPWLVDVAKVFER